MDIVTERYRNRWWFWPLVPGSLLVCAPCYAQEVTTYSYDAKGRVTSVVRTGGPVSGATTSYAFDKADNRVTVAVTSSPNGSGNGSNGSAPATKYIVTPLNGYTIIPVTQ